VVFLKGGEERVAEAGREVILCAGAINSPQILMLSGIGPGRHLRSMGVNVFMDLPGVGRNYQDHLMVPVSRHCRLPISLLTVDSNEARLKYTVERRGVLSSNRPEAGGFIRLNPTARVPELQMIFVPDWAALYDEANPGGHGFSLLPGLVGTKSIGSLELCSADPKEPPLIDPNYLAEEADMEVLVEGVKLARKILGASPFEAYRGDELIPGPAVQSDEEIREFVREFASNIYHSAGTCKMGGDGMAVVDDSLKVHGVQGLRVADASIMPFIVNANTNAPCIMIAEKCADMVLNGNE
jgi:choline dehydrogenase